mmetsp:Transcript_12688/g.23782  ORF Transcript_12688/g.23782 Transcript_12688/m.23782 type:complete len:183 (-) Transcript_12688:149-697(-)
MPHILHSIEPHQKEFNVEEATERCFVYITTEIASNKCKHPSGSSNRNTNCNCMSFLGERENIPVAKDVASYLVRWAGFDQVRKREVLHTWHTAASSYCYANNGSKTFKGKNYVVPRCGISGHENRLHQQVPFMICRNALTGLLNVGRKMWETSKTEPLSMHGNTGKKSNVTIKLEQDHQMRF